MKKRFILLALCSLMFSAEAYAQNIEDALRFSLPNGQITPRVANMGISYYGLADDIGALLYNPAGIGIIGKSEISLGLGFTRNSTETDYLDVNKALNTNDEYITHFGLVAPFATSKGSAAIGIGYFLESNFENNMDYSGYNNADSYISNYIQGAPKNDDKNMMYLMNLAGMDANGKLITPLDSALSQEGQITETGGLHNITGAVSWNVNESVAIGLSLTGKWGSYNYERNYTETDLMNLYSNLDNTNWTNIDFREFNLIEKLSQDISGITGALGVLGRIENFMRVGASIKFPTFYEITEDFSQEAKAIFDNDEDSWYNNNGENSYKVTTPFVYSAGMSFHAQGLTFSAGVEYTDVSQIEFSDATDEVLSKNAIIKRELVGQTSWGFGVEYQVPALPVIVRSSYSSTTSPYTEDISNASISRFSLGGGILLSSSVKLDAVFQWTDHSELRTNYLNPGQSGSTYIFTAMPTNLGFQITYRY